MENSNKNKEELKLMPEILLQRTIPAPLFGVNPRIIKGKSWWDKIRKEAYASTGYCCIACGVSKSEAKYHKWLEAHESFKFDDVNYIAEVERIVPLCHACHSFIHRGRLSIMLVRGLIDENRYLEILLHGLDVIRDSGLVLTIEQNDMLYMVCERICMPPCVFRLKKPKKLKPVKPKTKKQQKEYIKELNELGKKYDALGGWRLLLDGVVYPGKTDNELSRDYGKY